MLLATISQLRIHTIAMQRWLHLVTVPLEIKLLLILNVTECLES